MILCSGKDLSFSLREACDSATKRLWIASPYIGGWDSVRRVIGRTWWDREGLNFRLLTDPLEGELNGETLRRFIQRGEIRQLRGLHAKLYIIDDAVLLTSANLTGAAFSKRYEIGAWLKGTQAQEAINLFELWWGDPPSTSVESEVIAQLASKQGKAAGENGSGNLPLLNSLPSDPGDFGGHRLTNIFLDYPKFLRDYKVVTKEYLAFQRIWPHVPIYFELDGFFNYLFREHPRRPSKPYEEKAPRILSAAQRRDAIRRFAEEFGVWATQTNNDGRWRLSHSKVVRRLLSQKNIASLNKSEIRQVVEGLNCMNAARQRIRFLNGQKNSTAVIRKAWTGLLHGSGLDTERMSLCAGRLFGFKRSSVQELVGFFAPDKYPLRNATVNAGLRFFGFDVKPH